ncbi:MAG: hypothetical protein J3R72DRAFT_494993 [Linnemannia gamsii]|nr:MAG: hypothetical protein J3R72DRAFT_494993 [Linnemannia gamsii]
MADSRGSLFRLVDGEALSDTLPIEMESSKTISDLKDFIKAEQAPPHPRAYDRT